MGAEKMNVRSYRWHDLKKLAVAAIIICWIIIALSLCGILKPFIRRPLINADWGTKTKSNTNTNMKPIIFTHSNSRTDVYDVRGDVRIQGRSSSIFIASSGHDDDDELPWNSSRTIKPLPCKQDGSAMAKVTGFRMKTGPPDTIPQCTRRLDAPAILFSTGHIGNHFHRITDVLIPLFATSHHFHRRVIFLVADRDPGLTSKHRETLGKLSRYKVYDIDVEDEILCFPRMIVGLKAQEVGLSIDPTRSSSFSMRNFTKLLRSVYSLERERASRRRPRMLVVTRSTTRRLTNHVEVVDMARSLGFEAVAQDFGGSVASTAELVNTVDVMVGVHGAGLTNMVFLPESAVVVQITPLGLDLYARFCFGKDQAEEMKLKYLEYKVTLNESSLLGKYPPHSEVYKDSVRFCHKRFQTCKHVFMDNQDVNLDLPRFRKTLFQALDLLAAAS